MVNIYLNINNRYVHTLSIPLSDIQRLSVRPVKWLRFVTFAICGAQGHLSETPDGDPVNYNISLAGPIVENYYYTPRGNTHASQNCSLLLTWIWSCSYTRRVSIHWLQCIKWSNHSLCEHSTLLNFPQRYKGTWWLGMCLHGGSWLHMWCSTHNPQSQGWCGISHQYFMSLSY